MDDVAVGLDIGTTKTCAVIGFMNENNQVEAVIPDLYDVETTGYRGTCFINSIDMGKGTLLAQTAQTDVNSMGWIAEWPAGIEYYNRVMA